MGIKANELKNGDKGTITHWVNQPHYVGNTIEMTNDKVIMTDKNGFKTENVDMRYPHFCIIQNKNNMSTSVNWYKSLTIDRKLALKEVAVLICGMKWEEFNILFSPRERLDILYNKLKLEGFDI